MDRDLQDEMSKVYRKNLWGSSESRSGNGSIPQQTMYIEFEIPELIKRFNVSSILDIPCGDFGWMPNVLKRCPEDLRYYGADIVPDIIDDLKQYEDTTKSFHCLDVTSDPLPRVDMVFARDLFMHLTDEMIIKSFNNIRRSGAKYIAMTHFNWHHLPNIKLEDAVGGSWRKINWRLEPYNMPMPIDLISEGSSERLGKDKTIAVWKVKHLPRH